MSIKASAWKTFCVFLIAGAAACCIFIFFGAAGHGTYVPAMLLFPYTMISTYFFDEITAPFIILILLQFPVYGAIMAFAQYKKKGRLAGGIILASHLVAVFAAFIFTSHNFR